MGTVENTNRKVAIVGLRSVTATEVYSLLVSGRIENVVLVGDEAELLIHEINRVRALVPLSTDTQVIKGTLRDCADAKIAVLSGDHMFAGGDSAAIRRSVAEAADTANALRRDGFSGVLVVTGRPIEFLVRAVAESSGLPSRNLIGIGNRTDFVTPDSRISGAEAPAGSALPRGWCTAAAADVTYVDACTSDCPFFEALIANPSVSRPFRAEDKPHSPQRLAACVTQVCEAVVDDLGAVLPVFTCRNGNVVLATCVIGRDGITEVFEAEEASHACQAIERLWPAVAAKA